MGWQGFLYCYTGDTLFLKQISTFRANQLDQTCPQKTYPSFPGAFARPTFKVAFADEPRKSFHSEVPGLQATQCKPGKPAPYYKRTTKHRFVNRKDIERSTS